MRILQFYFYQAFLGGVRFHPLLGPYKKQWNKNIEKYGSFWDPEPILRALQAVPFDTLCHPDNLQTLRCQLIITCRLLCFYRSHDLATLKRTVSSLGGKTPFIKIKRKGHNVCKWENMVSLPQCPQVSPFHLLQAYVAATRNQGKVGGQFFLD